MGEGFTETLCIIWNSLNSKIKSLFKKKFLSERNVEALPLQVYIYYINFTKFPLKSSLFSIRPQRH